MDGLQIFDDINLHSRKSLEAKLNFQSVPASAAQAAAAAAEEANIVSIMTRIVAKRMKPGYVGGKTQTDGQCAFPGATYIGDLHYRWAPRAVLLCFALLAVVLFHGPVGNNGIV